MNLEQYFRNGIIKFYNNNKRHFFWREESLTTFQIMITEIFLKKTRSENVNRYSYNFIKKYKNNIILFLSSDKEISKSIKPLGLSNQRTIALRKISDFLHEKYNDKLPDNYDRLIEIPYIKEYTASAIMCFAFNKRYPILDVNSSRILSRFFLIPNKKDIRNNSKLKTKAFDIMPRKNFKEYNWGLLDFGASICKKNNPLCDNCPLNKKCDYY